MTPGTGPIIDASGIACRSCAAPLTRTLVDLGSQPLANSYPRTRAECAEEQRFPLHVRVCEQCWLVQLPEVVSAEAIFSDYPYFSSYSDTWVDHARRFATAAIPRFGLGPGSLVVELASNDGYLLEHFQARGVPALGVEPAANVAEVAASRGIPTRTAFFSDRLAVELCTEGRQADLVVANNVLAHVPDLNDFVAGIARMLKPDGVVSIEFPHLLELFHQVAFDTIYHEHFSYFSLLSAEIVLRRHDLRAFDVELLDTHGGSYRLMAGRSESSYPESQRLVGQRLAEERSGLAGVAAYERFTQRVDARASGVREFLETGRHNGARVAAYGAAAKGNTLLNYCGTTTDDIAYVVDRSPHKQGKYLPGSHLPVRDPEVLYEDKPDYLLILAWNLTGEIRTQVEPRCDWGMRFVTTVPELRVLP